MQTPIQEIPRWKTLLNSLRFLKDPIPLLNENQSRYGQTYRFYLGGLYPALFTADPGLIQYVLQKNHRNYKKSPAHFEKLAHFLGRGLLTSDGAYWLRQRRLIQPGFHRARLEGLTSLMQEVIDERLRLLDARVEAGPVDIYREMLDLAFRIIARSIFSVDLPDDVLERLGLQITQLQEMVIRQIRQPFLEPWFRLSGEIRKHERIAADLDAIILRYIRERRADTAIYNDLLQMLLDAKYEDTGEGMTEQQLLDELKILFVAGHETSANALAWTWYLLAQHPEVADRARQEIETVLKGAPASFSALPQLNYTTQIIEESMRLYPPAWITDRMAVEDDAFQGVAIPKGTYIVTYFYGVHHAPEFWENPEQFQPERFDAQRVKKHTPGAYLPFGAGPRLCIGNHFAMMEMQLVLAAMLPRYRMAPTPGRSVSAEPLVTLRPKDGIWLNLEK
ncbi:MAG: cytochrome P450 [Haliscomenobacter sp.]|nr:cytochrome P450 [Haliscomenobacter sp.]